MFGFGKKKKKTEEKMNDDKGKRRSTRLDKLVMGAIVGAAVGSVVGISFKTKKGKEIKNQADGEPKSQLGKIAKGLFFGKKKEKKIEENEKLRKIPHEIE